MTILPSNLSSSLAASPSAQNLNQQQQQVESAAHHARATGVIKRTPGTESLEHAEENSATFDRDADGRRPWELNRSGKSEPTAAPEEPSAASTRPPDPTGQSGQLIDLIG